MIYFEGSGASTTVVTVKVENLTQGKNMEITGCDVPNSANIFPAETQ